jgi:phosphonate transport system substrate-binding protein
LKRTDKNFTRASALLTIAAALACGLTAANVAGQPLERTKPQTLSLGVVSEIDRAPIAARFSDFARYLASNLSSASDIEGKVVIAPTPFQLAKLIEQNKVDLYLDSAYPTYFINDVYGVARLLLRRWKGGVVEYRSLIFTKRNGGINRLEDLSGKLFVFEDPDSTSGHLLPKSFLRQRGFKFNDKSRFNPNASPGDIDYRFAYSQEKVVDWVLSRKAAAGAFSDADFARLEEKKRADIAILARTQPLPRHFISVRKDFAPALADRLVEILLSMHGNDSGRQILRMTDDTTKFDRLPEGESELRRRLAEIFHP